MTLELILDQLKDSNVRENFFRILKFIKIQPLFVPDFKFYEIVITAAVTNYKFKHNLGYRPLDVIQTSNIGAGAVTFNFDEFDSDFLDITTTGAVTIRAFVGAHRGTAQ